jgi:hypothetical protein
LALSASGSAQFRAGLDRLGKTYLAIDDPEGFGPLSKAYLLQPVPPDSADAMRSALVLKI